MKRKPARPVPIIRRPAAGAFSLRGNPPVMAWSIVYAPPPSAGYPDATNTGLVGAGVSYGSLTSSGSITTSANNQIIELKDISGGIFVDHSGVIIRKCRITVPWGGNGVESEYASRTGDVIVEDCEIIATTPNANNWSLNGVMLEWGGTIRRCNIYGGFENAIIFSNSGGTVEDNYLHDILDYELVAAHDPHIDVVQFWTGISNVTFQHNWVEGRLTSSSACTWGTDNSNIIVDNNVFFGGAYVFRMGEGGSCGTNIQITNNKFSQYPDGVYRAGCGYYGAWSVGSNSGRSGNTYYESGLPISDGA